MIAEVTGKHVRLIILSGHRFLELISFSISDLRKVIKKGTSIVSLVQGIELHISVI